MGRSLGGPDVLLIGGDSGVPIVTPLTPTLTRCRRSWWADFTSSR